MSKKLIKEKRYNVGIVESYKKTDQGHQNLPVLGEFSVKGMTVENKVSQNRTRYSERVWASPNAFGKGGKYIDESGKLIGSSLYGSLDHPMDDRAEFRLEEAAIAWYDVTRNDDGSWDGKADILKTPQGQIVATMLEYSKMRGGGHLLGVSSRALGEAETVQESSGYIDEIQEDSFELMSFDFVYNPSFTNQAHLNEAAKADRRSLTESIKALAEDDKENEEVYTKYAETLEPKEDAPLEESVVLKYKDQYIKDLRKEENKLQNELYAVRNMEDEEFLKKHKLQGPKASGARERYIQKLEDSLFEIKSELELGGEKPKEVRPESTEEKKDEEATVETVTEKTFAEAGRSDGSNAAKWELGNLSDLVRTGLISAQQMIDVVEPAIAEEYREKFNALSRRKKVLVAIEYLRKNPEWFEKLVLNNAELLAKYLGLPRVEDVFSYDPVEIVQFARSKSSEKMQELTGIWDQNIDLYKQVRGESIMSKNKATYRINLEKAQAAKLESFLKEKEIYFETSEYGEKTRFDILLSIGDRIIVNREVKELTEGRILRKNPYKTLTEAEDVLDEFLDDEKDDGLENKDDAADDKDAGKDDDVDDEDKDDEEEDDEDKDGEEEEEDLEAKVDRLLGIVEELQAFLIPVEDGEEIIDDVDLDVDGEEGEDGDDEGEEGDEDLSLEDVDPDDLEDLSDDELEYLLNLED